MEVLHDCGCGLDVHARTVVACLITKGRKELQTFSTGSSALNRDEAERTGCKFQPPQNSLRLMSVKAISLNPR